VSLHELAAVANMSPFHLAWVFRQAQGFEVGYVAHETGFADQSHFTRQFKRSFLVPPGSYRRTTSVF